MRGLRPAGRCAADRGPDSPADTGERALQDTGGHQVHGPSGVVVLAGGTGGAKLARGMLDAVGGDRLTVIANTGDDHDFFGVHVSPDPDLVTWWLADLIDERGWGIRGDTWKVMEGLAAAGSPAWFQLGDRDLAFCLIRTKLLREGERLTAAHAAVVTAAGAGARVLPMCDEEVRTVVLTDAGRRPFQEFMIVDRAEPEVRGVEFTGVEGAAMTPEVEEAIAAAGTIVIGPSNPVISIGPILTVPGMSDALRSSPAPVVAVSPFVGGRALKGPTEKFCAHTGIEASAAGIASAYSGVIDGIVADEECPGTEALVTDTLMNRAEARRSLAAACLEFAGTLRREE